MKKTIGKLASLMLALIMVIGVLANPAFAVNEKTFDDVAEGEWYYGYVMMLAEDDIVGGFSGTNEFRPDSKLTREQAAKMIALAAKFEHEGLQSEFEDVDPNGWATGYIAALETREVVKGWGTTGEFRPMNNIQRGHAAKMVGKAFGLKEGSLERTLTDLPADAEVEEAIKVLASNGIVKGYGGTEEFRPAEEISRAEFSKILCIAMVASAIQEAEAEGATSEQIEKAQALLERLSVAGKDDDIDAMAYLQGRVDALELTVTDVSAIDDITITVGGTYELPETVEITLSDDSEVEVAVEWDETEVDVDVAGMYVVEGTLDLTELEDVAETELVATVNVEVITKLEAADRAVEKFEASLANADLTEAQDLVDGLGVPADATNAQKGALQDRINAVKAERADYVDAVNNAITAKSQFALLAALNDGPFEGVNSNFIVGYFERLESNNETIEDVQEAIDAINVTEQLLALPVADEVTLDDKAEIEAARVALDEFTSKYNDATKISPTAREQLTEAEAALEALELEAAKKAAIEELENYVNAEDYTENATELANEITHYKKAISDAPHIESVNTRLDIAKGQIEKIKTDLELATAAVEIVENTPSAGPGRFTEAQRLIKILPEGAEKDALQARLDAVIAAKDKAEADAEAAAEVDALINDIGLRSNIDAGDFDEEDVLAARIAYDALTEEQVELVTVYAKLEAAEKVLADNEEAIAKAEAAVKAAEDAPLASEGNKVDKQNLVTKAQPLIEAIIGEVGAEDKGSLETRLDAVQAELNSTVFNQEQLVAALENEAVTEIRIDGTIGSEDDYTVYNVDRAVTIKGGADAKVFGTFIVKADDVTIKDLAIQNKGDLKGESTTNRGGIYVFANNVTLTNNTITNGLGTHDGLSNAIQIMSPTENTPLSNYVITGNKITGHIQGVPNWSSSGIVIAQNFTPGSIGEEVKAISATEADYTNLLTNNTFENNKIDLTHQDWSKTGDEVVLYPSPEK